MLNFEEFQEYVAMNLSEELPEDKKDARVELGQVTKNNGRELHSVIVHGSDSNIAPTIYLEGFYQRYKDGAELDDIMKDIAKVATDNIAPPVELANVAEDFQRFDYVKDKIIMTVVNSKKNAELLTQVPHINREDLSLVYKVMLGTNDAGMGTIMIRNEHMAGWGTTTEEIHELAMKNSKELLPASVQSMNDVMMGMMALEDMPDDMKEAMFEPMPLNQQMFVITNEAKIGGAAAVFYEDVVSDLADKIGTDLFILPSSVHECLAVSTDMGTAEELANMVQEVNSTEVSVDEFLSDHVYRYDAESRTLSLADTTAEKLGRRVSDEQVSYDATGNTAGNDVTNTETVRPRHRR